MWEELSRLRKVVIKGRVPTGSSTTRQLDRPEVETPNAVKVLTKVLIEKRDVTASEKWAKDQARPQKVQRRADRVAHIKWLLTYPGRRIKSAVTLRTSPELNANNPPSEPDGSVHNLCEG
jgi:hypothetical protein